MPGHKIIRTSGSNHRDALHPKRHHPHHGEVWSRQPLVGLGMVVFLWLAFRRFRYAVLPFLSVALASLWWLGLMQLTGGSINVINFSTVTVILVIGIGDAIHLVARVEEGLDAQQSPFEALVTGWRAMLPAITLTTTTTVIGFASLSVARVELVRAYGQSAALGIALCWLFTLSVVPALLLIAPPQSKVRHSNERLWLNRVALPAVSVFVRARPGLISACSVAIFVISLVFASQLEPFSRALEEVQEDHPAQVALTDLERQFTGAMPFDIVLEGPRDELLKPSNLRRIATLQERLDASPAGIRAERRRSPREPSWSLGSRAARKPRDAAGAAGPDRRVVKPYDPR